MQQNIFINYRRQSDSGMAGRIYDSLSRALPGVSIFMDVDKLTPGDDFEVALQKNLDSCKVLLAVIGPDWVKLADSTGQRRIDDPADFVRKEISVALAKGIRVIPVLIGGAEMPVADALTSDLKPLAKRQAMEIRHQHFGADVDAVAKAIISTVPGARGSRGRFAGIAVAAGLAVVLAGGFLFFPGIVKQETSSGCKPGFVWRKAQPLDHICVTRDERAAVAVQNANAADKRQPGGGQFGPNTCLVGFVWRDAFKGDEICVTPPERDLANKQNFDQAQNASK